MFELTVIIISSFLIKKGNPIICIISMLYSYLFWDTIKVLQVEPIHKREGADNAAK